MIIIWKGAAMDDCISVVIPVYNGAATLAEALNSVLIQELVKEILVIDDASDDETNAIAHAYCQKSGKVTYICNETNLGAAASRNKGVALASAPYIAFLDADDCWDAGKLRAQMALMHKSGAVISSTARELIETDGRRTGHIIPIKHRITYNDLLRHNSLSCSAVVAKRDVLLQFPMEHEDSHEDYITWLKIVRKYGFAAGLNRPYLKYRMSKHSKSGSKWKSARMTFKVYRYLGLSVPQSLLCFLSYALHGIYKYYIAHRQNSYT